MTKKDYVEIASVLLYGRPEGASGPAVETWMRIVNEFARRLAAQNPRFDLKKFYSACGV